MNKFYVVAYYKIEGAYKACLVKSDENFGPSTRLDADLDKLVDEVIRMRDQAEAGKPVTEISMIPVGEMDKSAKRFPTHCDKTIKQMIADRL